MFLNIPTPSLSYNTRTADTIASPHEECGNNSFLFSNLYDADIPKWKKETANLLTIAREAHASKLQTSLKAADEEALKAHAPKSASTWQRST